MELIITKHARVQMLRRDVSEEQVKRCIKQGARFRQTNGYISDYAYIRVAYKKLKRDVYKIKTVMIKC